MNIDSDKAKAFAVLEQTLNFSKVANELHISQPALSKKISNLDTEIGVSLLIRSKRMIELTAVGHEPVNYWKSKIEIDRDFLSRMGSEHMYAPETMKKIPGKKKVLSPFYLCYLKRTLMTKLLSEMLMNLRPTSKTISSSNKTL